MSNECLKKSNECLWIDIEKAFDEFMEFPTDNRKFVTSTSCKLFAEYCVKISLADHIPDAREMIGYIEALDIANAELLERVQELRAQYKGHEKRVNDEIISLNLAAERLCLLSEEMETWQKLNIATNARSERTGSK